MTNSVIAVSNRPEMISDFMPKQLPYTLLNFNRETKGILKNSAPLMLLFDLLDNSVSHREVSKLLKVVPKNASCYLIILAEGNDDNLAVFQATEVMHEYQQISANSDRLVNLFDLLKNNHEQLQQAKAQTDLLLSINHFAQFRTPWQTLVLDFATGLAGFSNATTSLLFDNKQQSLIELELSTELDCKLSKQTIGKLSEQVIPATELTQPNVNLLVEQTLYQLLLSDTNKEIEAILTFPLVVYDQIVQTVVCLIDKEQMSKISVQHIDTMKQAAIQLTILIERRVAENKLKSQYQRLKNALQELQETKDQLVHSEKMAAVGKLAAGIAHEINNPLSYVLGNLEPLDDYVETIVKLLTMHDELLGNLDESLSEQSHSLRLQIEQEQEEEDLDFVLQDIKAIVDNSKEGLLRVRDIINDLSSFSRQQPLELQTFNVKELLEETVRLLKYELSNGVEIKLKEQMYFDICAHRGFIQQILTNLIKNAINALQDAAIKAGCIELSYYELGEDLVITVTDNGPGIPAEIQKSIFTPFFTTKGVGEGTGLGLSVSYNLAKKMNGRLELESEQGKTTFSLTLPKG